MTSTLHSFKAWLALLAVTVLAGCAHPIAVVPDQARLARSADAPAPMPLRVGYHIPAALADMEVTTPGGGGDNIRYFPYRDIDAGFEKMLSNVFSDIVKLPSIAKPAETASSGVHYVIVPTIVTTSGGSGLFTWPPTSFSVDLTSQIRDPAGTLVASPRVVGFGSAETSERIFDHGIAGRRAMEDALLRMQAALRETSFSGAPAQRQRGTTSERLDQLKALRERKDITEEEYEKKRKEILDAL
ncbi:hypothetical protein [Variovorax sp.]|uniref:hypothetical protein n=1 Tax=Variovorax sp. TaxID=1871043 RepID=UPI003BABF1E2